MHRLLVKVGDATDKSVYPEKKPRRSPKARLFVFSNDIEVALRVSFIPNPD